MFSNLRFWEDNSKGCKQVLTKGFRFRLSREEGFVRVVRSVVGSSWKGKISKLIKLDQASLLEDLFVAVG